MVIYRGNWLGGRLAIRPEESDSVTVSRGVDTDADAVENGGDSHGQPPLEEIRDAWYNVCQRMA
jgi:hypothetical protein